MVLFSYRHRTTFCWNGFLGECSIFLLSWRANVQFCRTHVRFAIKLLLISDAFLVKLVIRGVDPVLSSLICIIHFIGFNTGQDNFMIILPSVISATVLI